MASKGFNLTAEINLRGPANLKQVASRIKSQLGNIQAKVQIDLGKNASKNISSINSKLQNLNTTLATTTSNATSAAQAFSSLVTAVRGLSGVNIPTNIPSTINVTGKALSSATSSVKIARTEFEEFGRQSALAVRRFAAFSSVTSVIYSFSNALSSGIKDYIEFDRQITRLSQVTEQSKQSLGSLSAELTRLSTTFGVSSKELAQTSVTLAQAGFTALETKKALEALAKSALAPSFDDLNSTVEGSIALMRQFGISSNQLEGALGSINSVAAAFAVEASDLITAIQRTGGVFASASKGVSSGTDALNEFLAIFTSIRATTRESAETIATGLRTIFTRIQRSETIEALKDYGVVLTDLEGKFVGPYEATRRLAEGLSRLDPRNLKFSEIVEELGGFRQIGKVLPLIQQFATAQDALKVAQTGQGSLASDAAKGQLALAVQIQKVKEEFSALIRSIGDSDGFQTLVRLGLDLASALIKIADATKGVLPLIGLIAAFKGVSAITQFVGGFGSGLRSSSNRRANGGPIYRFNSGGIVPGSGKGDKVPALLEPGEVVMSNRAVRQYGRGNLVRMNKYGSGGSVASGLSVQRKQRFAKGGPVTIEDLQSISGGSKIQPDYRSINQIKNKVGEADNSWSAYRKNDQIGKPSKRPRATAVKYMQPKDLVSSQVNYIRIPDPDRSEVEKYWGNIKIKPNQKTVNFKDKRLSDAYEQYIADKIRNIGKIKDQGKYDPLDFETGDAKFFSNEASIEKFANKELIISKRLRHENKFNKINWLQKEGELRELPPTAVYHPTDLTENNNLKTRIESWVLKNQTSKTLDAVKFGNQFSLGGEIQKFMAGSAGGVKSKPEPFGTGATKFPRRISNAYTKQMEKEERDRYFDRLIQTSPINERIMVDEAMEQQISQGMKQPLDREKFAASFRRAVLRDEIASNISNFAKFIGLPEEDLSVVLPRQLDFGSGSGPVGSRGEVVLGGAFSTISPYGSRGAEGWDLSEFGYSKQDEQDLFGFEKLLEEKKKELAKIRKTPTRTFDDGSFSFDVEAFDKAQNEVNVLQKQIFDIGDKRSTAISKAKKARETEVASSGRGTLGFGTRFGKAQNPVFYHELTHQLFKGLRAKSADSFDKYKQRVTTLFETDNDGLADAFDALGDSYSSADVVYGRSYKLDLLGTRQREEVRINPSGEDVKNLASLIRSGSAAKKATEFRPINPDFNSAMLKFYSQEHLDKVEDNGKEEFLTTLVQKMPVLDERLQGILDSTITELLRGAGIQRQRFNLGGMARFDGGGKTTKQTREIFDTSPTPMLKAIIARTEGKQPTARQVQLREYAEEITSFLNLAYDDDQVRDGIVSFLDQHSDRLQYRDVSVKALKADLAYINQGRKLSSSSIKPLKKRKGINPGDMLDTIMAYQSIGLDYLMNTALAEGRTDQTLEEFMGENVTKPYKGTARGKTKISQLVKNMEAAAQHEMPSVLYSGLGDSKLDIILKQAKITQKNTIDDLVGKTFSIPSFLSASSAEALATHFARAGMLTISTNPKRKGIIPENAKRLTIDNTPLSDRSHRLIGQEGDKGFAGLPVDRAYANAYDTEGEHIFPPNSKFKITDVERGVNTRLFAGEGDDNYRHVRMKVQQLKEGGVAKRNVGYIDYDVIANPANEAVVNKGMESTGVKGPRLYTDHLTDLAVKARKDSNLQKLRAIYGVAGSGKTTLARGQGTDKGKLRETTRFPILTPEDIQKANEVLILSSSVSKDKLDSFFSEVDRAYTLSSTTAAEKETIKAQRASRDITGEGLEGRTPGGTMGVGKDTAVGEALLQDRLGSRSVVLGRSDSGKVRRKRGDELVEVIKKKIGFTWGGFAPMTAGHESIMDSAAAMGIPPEDFIYLVGANEGIKAGDASSYRTAIFDQDARVLLAKAGAGAKGATVLPKPRDFEVPQAFDVSPETGRRKVIIPGKGSTAFVADKGPEELKKYTDAGYKAKNLPRTGGISGTMVRELIEKGDLGKLQSVLSPNVYDLISNNIGRIQNRAQVLPQIISQVQQNQGIKLADIEKAIKAVGISRVDKKKLGDPEYAAKVQVLEELRRQRDKIKSAAAFEPYKLLEQLARSQPDKYGLDFSTGTTPVAKPIRTVRGKPQTASLGGLIQRFAKAGKVEGPKQANESMSTEELISMAGGQAESARILGEAGIPVKDAFLQLRKILRGSKTKQDARRALIQSINEGYLRGIGQLTDQGLMFGAVGMEGNEYTDQYREISEKLTSPVTVGITGRLISDRYRSIIEQQFNTGISQATVGVARAVTIADILQDVVGGSTLISDFDKVINEGADNILSDSTKPQFSEFADRNKVEDALKKSKLTTFGLSLVDLLSTAQKSGGSDAYNELLNRMYINTARPQTTVDLIKSWLDSVNLPIPSDNIVGVGGPGVSGSDIPKLKAAIVSKISSANYPASTSLKSVSFIDDALSNVEGVSELGLPGTKSYLYPTEYEPKSEDNTAKGVLLQNFLEKLGAPRGKSMDFPTGLKAASKFVNDGNLFTNIPTDAKYTLSGPNDLIDNITNYLVGQGYKGGGSVNLYHGSNTGVKQFARGGSVPALVSNGEAYVPPKLAKRIGYGTLNRMNQADRNGMGRFSSGGISIFRGPGTGTSDSIPTSLPVGSFIIREKATKALGLSGGGSVQRFSRGGGPPPARPTVVSAGTIGAGQQANSALALISATLADLGVVSTQTSLLLAKGYQVTAGAALAATKADLELAKASGASATQIYDMQKAISDTEKEIQDEIKIRNRLGDIDGSRIQRFFDDVDSSVERLLQQDKAKAVSLGMSSEEAEKALREGDASKGIRSAEERREIALNRVSSTSRSAAFGGLGFNPSSLGVQGKQVEDVLRTLSRDGKTLAQMNAQYIASQRQKIQSDASLSLEEKQKRIKALDEEVAARTRAIQQISQAEGTAGPTSESKNSFSRLQLGLGVSTIGNLAAQNIDVTSSQGNAEFAGALSGFSTGLGTAQTALGALEGVGIKIPGIWGEVASLGIGVAQAFMDAKNAALKFQIELENKKLEISLDKVGKNFEKLDKDIGNKNILSDIQKELENAAAIAIRSIEIPKESGRVFWANLGEVLTTENPTQTAKRSQILEKSGVSSYFSSLGSSENLSAEFAKLIPTMAIESSKAFSATADGINRLFEEKLRTGTNLEDLLNNNEFAKQREVIARSNSAIEQQILSIENSTVMNDAQKKAAKENVIAIEAETQIRTRSAVIQRELEIKNLENTSNRFARSMERTYQNMEQSINAASFALQSMGTEIDLVVSSLQGQAKIGTFVSSNINTIQNPRAYSENRVSMSRDIASQFFGPVQSEIRSLLDIPENLEQTVLSTINKTVKENPNITEEALGGKIITSVSEALDKLGLPPDLSDKLSSEVKNVLKDLTRNNKDDTVDYGQIAEKLGSLNKIIETATRAQEVAVKALEHFYNSLNAYSQNNDKIIDIQIAANEKFRKSLDIVTNSAIELDKALGKSISVRTNQDILQQQIRNRTGGATDPNQIFDEILRLENTRVAQRADAQRAGDRGISGVNDFIKFNDDLRKSSLALRENIGALQLLANSSEVASAALNKIQELQQKQAGKVSYIEKLVTSTPEEFNALQASFIRLQRNLNGQLNTINNSTGAQKAYNEAIQKGSSAIEAMQAAQNAFVNERKETLGALNDLLPFLGEGQQAGNLRANVLESMLRESGVGVSPMFQQILNTLRNPEADPATQEAIRQYKEAINLQSEANRLLSKLDQNLADDIATKNADALVQAIKGVPLTFESSELKDIRNDVKVIRVRVENNNRPANPPQAASKGGLIYAAAGQMIDFQPKGTDTVPAMLTPGEFVVNRSATQQNLPLLKAINNGMNNGGMVYLQDGGLVAPNLFTDKANTQDQITRDKFIDPDHKYENENLGSVWSGPKQAVYSQQGLNSYYPMQGDFPSPLTNELLLGAGPVIRLDTKSRKVPYTPELYSTYAARDDENLIERTPTLVYEQATKVNESSIKLGSQIPEPKTRHINSTEYSMGFRWSMQRLKKLLFDPHRSERYIQSSDNLQTNSRSDIFDPNINSNTSIGVVVSKTQDDPFNNSNKQGIENTKIAKIVRLSAWYGATPIISTNPDGNSTIRPTPTPTWIIENFAHEWHHKKEKRKNFLDMQKSRYEDFKKSFEFADNNNFNSVALQSDSNLSSLFSRISNIYYNKSLYETFDQNPYMNFGPENLGPGKPIKYLHLLSREVSDQLDRALIANEDFITNKLESNQGRIGTKLRLKNEQFNSPRIIIQQKNGAESSKKRFSWIGNINPGEIIPGFEGLQQEDMESRASGEKYGISFKPYTTSGSFKTKIGKFNMVDIPYNLPLAKYKGKFYQNNNFIGDFFDTIIPQKSEDIVNPLFSLSEDAVSLDRTPYDIRPNDIFNRISHEILMHQPVLESYLDGLKNNNLEPNIKNNVEKIAAQFVLPSFKDSLDKPNGLGIPIFSENIGNSIFNLNIGKFLAHALKTTKNNISNKATTKANQIVGTKEALQERQYGAIIKEMAKGSLRLFNTKSVNIPNYSSQLLYSWISSIKNIFSNRSLENNGIPAATRLTEIFDRLGTGYDRVMTNAGNNTVLVSRAKELKLLATGATNAFSRFTAGDTSIIASFIRSRNNIENLYRTLGGSSQFGQLGAEQVGPDFRANITQSLRGTKIANIGADGSITYRDFVDNDLPRNYQDMVNLALNPYNKFTSVLPRKSLISKINEFIIQKNRENNPIYDNRTLQFITEHLNTLTRWYGGIDNGIWPGQDSFLANPQLVINSLQTPFGQQLRNFSSRANQELGAEQSFGQLPDLRWFNANRVVQPVARQYGGLIYANQGTLVNYQPRGTDTVPAMLTPGEFVVNRAATQRNLPLLQSINSGVGGYSDGGIVYAQKGDVVSPKNSKTGGPDRIHLVDEPTRIFLDSTGQHEQMGILSEIQLNNSSATPINPNKDIKAVRIKKPNNKYTTVPIELLSDHDQFYTKATLNRLLRSVTQTDVADELLIDIPNPLDRMTINPKDAERLANLRQLLIRYDGMDFGENFFNYGLKDSDLIEMYEKIITVKDTGADVTGRPWESVTQARKAFLQTKYEIFADKLRKFAVKNGNFEEDFMMTLSDKQIMGAYEKSFPKDIENIEDKNFAREVKEMSFFNALEPYKIMAKTKEEESFAKEMDAFAKQKESEQLADAKQKESEQLADAKQKESEQLAEQINRSDILHNIYEETKKKIQDRISAIKTTRDSFIENRNSRGWFGPVSDFISWSNGNDFSLHMIKDMDQAIASARFGLSELEIFKTVDPSEKGITSEVTRQQESLDVARSQAKLPRINLKTLEEESIAREIDIDRQGGTKTNEALLKQTDKGTVEAGKAAAYTITLLGIPASYFAGLYGTVGAGGTTVAAGGATNLGLATTIGVSAAEGMATSYVTNSLDLDPQDPDFHKKLLRNVLWEGAFSGLLGFGIGKAHLLPMGIKKTYDFTKGILRTGYEKIDEGVKHIGKLMRSRAPGATRRSSGSVERWFRETQPPAQRPVQGTQPPGLATTGTPAAPSTTPTGSGGSTRPSPVPPTTETPPAASSTISTGRLGPYDPLAEMDPATAKSFLEAIQKRRAELATTGTPAVPSTTPPVTSAAPRITPPVTPAAPSTIPTGSGRLPAQPTLEEMAEHLEVPVEEVLSLVDRGILSRPFKDKNGPTLRFSTPKAPAETFPELSGPENLVASVRAGAERLQKILSEFASSDEAAKRLTSAPGQDIFSVGMVRSYRKGELPPTSSEKNARGYYRFSKIGSRQDTTIGLRDDSVAGTMYHELAHAFQRTLLHDGKGFPQHIKQLKKHLGSKFNKFLSEDYPHLLRDMKLSPSTTTGNMYEPNVIKDNPIELFSSLVQAFSTNEKIFRQHPAAMEMMREIMKFHGYSRGGIVYASQGTLVNYQPRGTDTVPAMLTPGEFVVNRAATQRNLPLLQSINSGNYANGGIVYAQKGGGPLPANIATNRTDAINLSDISKYIGATNKALQNSVDSGFSSQKPYLSSTKNLISSVATVLGRTSNQTIGQNIDNILNDIPMIYDLINHEHSITRKTILTLLNDMSKCMDCDQGDKNRQGFWETDQGDRGLRDFLANLLDRDELTNALGLAGGGMVYARDGMLIPYEPHGTDTVPAMLTPGEFVVNANATKKNLGLLKAINGGAKGYSKGGVAYLEDGGITESNRVDISDPEQVKQAVGSLYTELEQYVSNKQLLARAFAVMSSKTTIKQANQTAVDRIAGSKNAAGAYVGYQNQGTIVFPKQLPTTEAVKHELGHAFLMTANAFNAPLQQLPAVMSFINNLAQAGAIPSVQKHADKPKNYKNGGIVYLKDGGRNRRGSGYLGPPWLSGAQRGEGGKAENIKQKTPEERKAEKDQSRRSNDGNNDISLYSREKLLATPKEIFPTILQLLGTASFSQYGGGEALSAALSAIGFQGGGIIYANEGMLVSYRPKGTDTVPAMLTPGEFVVNRAATQKHLPLLKAINNGITPYAQGGVVYAQNGAQIPVWWTGGAEAWAEFDGGLDLAYQAEMARRRAQYTAERERRRAEYTAERERRREQPGRRSSLPRIGQRLLEEVQQNPESFDLLNDSAINENLNRETIDNKIETAVANLDDARKQSAFISLAKQYLARYNLLFGFHENSLKAKNEILQGDRGEEKINKRLDHYFIRTASNPTLKELVDKQIENSKLESNVILNALNDIVPNNQRYIPPMDPGFLANKIRSGVRPPILLRQGGIVYASEGTEEPLTDIPFPDLDAMGVGSRPIPAVTSILPPIEELMKEQQPRLSANEEAAEAVAAGLRIRRESHQRIQTNRRNAIGTVLTREERERSIEEEKAAQRYNKDYERKQRLQRVRAGQFSVGGIVYASEGTLVNYQPRGTDTVPAMLTPGEFVINRQATQKHLPLLQSINDGYYNNGGVVYASDGLQITEQNNKSLNIFSSIIDKVSNNLDKFSILLQNITQNSSGVNNNSTNSTQNVNLEGISQFTASFDRFINQLQKLTIPPEIKITLTQQKPIDVNINGAEALQKLLEGPLGQIVQQNVQAAMDNINNQNEGTLFS